MLYEVITVSLDLDDVPPFHGLVALAVARFGAHGVAVTIWPAVAIIEDIIPFFRSNCCLYGHSQEKCRDRQKKYKEICVSHGIHLLSSKDLKSYLNLLP